MSMCLFWLTSWMSVNWKSTWLGVTKTKSNMRIVSDISLRDFGFWSGARDTADQLTDEQLDQVEAVLEDMYPDGMTDTQLNDIFWFESESVYEWAGCFPKFFKLTATCGLVKYVKAEDSDDVNIIESSYCEHDEVEESECDDVESVSDVELDDFSDTHYFAIRSRITHHEIILHCQGDEAADDLKDAFSMCEIEEITEVPADGLDNEEDWEDYENDTAMIDEFAYDEDEMWNSYDIPVYAIHRLCKLILDPNDFLDYYEIPESTAINEYNRYLELNDEDIKNIDCFVANLHKAMPEGFTIDWDVESVGSPYFDPYPAFGKGMDCVKLRVYPKNNNNVDD